MPRLAVLLLIGLATTLSNPGRSALQAQTAQQRPTFRTGVELVQVDVVVLDADGNPVRNLTAGDFTILDGRQSQPIEAFTEISHVWADSVDQPRPPSNVRADVADNSSAQSERIVILVVDDINIWVERVDLVKRMAHRVVAELGREASMAVIFTSGDGSVEITQDRAVLHDAIDDFEGAWHRFRVSGSCTPDNLQACQRFDTLQQVAKAIGVEDQRRKAVVVISEGQQVNTSGVFATNQLPDATFSGSAEAFAAPQMTSRSNDAFELRKMMQAFHRGNVTFYGVDPRGRLQTAEERRREDRGESDETPLRMNDPLYWSQQGLIDTAEASGGFAIVDTNDFDEGLDRIVADLDNYYLLGFYPKNPEDESWHSLAVSVNRPGVTVRHRRGYQLGGEKDRPKKNEDALAELSEGLLPKTGLPLRLFATPALRDGKDSRVAITAEVRVPSVELERPGGRLEDTLTLRVFAVDLDRRKVEESAWHEVDFVIPRSRVLPDGDVTYQLVFGLDLKPGSYQLRVSAESARLDEAGSVYLTLEVPDVRDERVSIAGPTIGFAPGTRLAAGMTLAEDGLLPRGLDPVLDRVFDQSDILRLYYQVWRRDENAEIPARLDVLDESDRVVFSIDDVIESRSAGVVDVSVPLSGLPPGGYRVRIRAGTADHTAEQEMGFAVRRER